MASDGKIIIDTKLDTSGFEKDIETAGKKAANDLGKGTEKAMKQAETSIKNVGKAVKNIDFSNIAKQMDNVSKSIENTSAKIELQKNKLGNLKKAFESATNVNTKNKIQEQMLNTEASIIKLENKLNGLNSKKIKLDATNGLDGQFSSASMSAVKSLDKIEKKAQETGNSIRKNMGSLSIGEGIVKAGNSISSVGNKLTMGVTLPVVGLGTAIGKIGMDFDSQMSRVKAISGATGEDFTKLKGQALQLGKDTAFSSKQCAEGFENLASAGFTVNEMTQAMPGLLDLAASSGESLASSSDIAASTLRGFGLAADQTGHVADVLAKNAADTNAAVADTGEAMKYVAPAAHSAGLGIEEVTAAIGIMANSGIKGSQAGTTLRSALTRLASPAKEAADKMKEINFSGFDDKGKMKSLSTIINDLTKSLKGKTDQQKQDYIATIFGQEAMSGMLTLIDSGSGKLDELTNSYKNADGAASDMAKTMQDNSKSSVEQMMGSLETAAIKLEEVAAPSIIKITGDIQEMANKFADLSPETQEFIIKAALAAAAMGPLAKVIGGVTGSVGGLIKFGKSVGGALGLIGTGAETGEAAMAGFSVAGGVALAAVSALAIGIAGAVTYNDLLGKSMDTSTDDLNTWQKVVNACTGGTIKSKEELQKAGLVYKDFGEGVSDSFKDGIKKATEEYHNFEVLLNQSDLSKKLEEANGGKISASINKIIDEAKQVINDRKGELQKDIMAGMTADGTGVDENEQKVLDIIGKSSDGKLAKVAEIQGNITKTWNDAIKNHGKLSEEDVQIIQKYMRDIENIKMEASAKNTAESTFVENSFNERLDGLSSEDAKKEYTDTSKTIHDNYSKLKATYKTEVDSLNVEIEKARKEGRNSDIKTLQQEIDDKNNLYDKSMSEEQVKRRKLLDMMYKKNPTLEGNFNEIDGSMFSDKDRTSKKQLDAIESRFTAIAGATKTGMKHVQDSLGGWHDVFVEVDESTGNITSAFDVNAKAGEAAIGGYSEKFEKASKDAANKAKENARKLAEAFQMDFGSLVSKNGKASKMQLQGDSIVNVDTGATLSQFDTIITKADETKIAIANINGVQVKIEFNKDGTVKNAKDVRDAAVNKIEKSPAKINIDVDDKKAVERFKQLEDFKTKFSGQELKEKVTIDGEDTSSINNIISKLEKLPRDSKVNLKINGEEITTVDEAIKKLNEVPKETVTKITVDGKEVTTADEAIKKFNEIRESNPNATITINGEQISTADEAKKKLDEITASNPNTTIKIESSDADTKLDTTQGKMDNLPSDKTVTVHIKTITDVINGMAQSAGEGLQEVLAMPYKKKYTGTSGGEEGLITKDEHGWEMSTGENELYYLGSGTGILDHGSSVNAMKRDVDGAVNSKVGSVVNTLVTNLARQNGILSQVAKNTGDTATNSKDTAESLLVGINNSTSGSFTRLKSEIDAANTEKDRTSNLKVDNYAYYGIAKQNLDDLNGQIDDLKNKSQELTDNLGENATESAKKAVEASKKEIEAQQHVLEKKKDIAQQEENIAKEAAQSEIEASKNAAEQQIKIAEEKKEKLTKLAEAVTEAIKNELTEQKAAAEKVLNDDLKDLENSYNKKVSKIEKSAKSKSDSIDRKIKLLEEETTDTSREDERKSANDNIFSLTTKMNNTASIADKRSLALQLKNAQKELDKKEVSWDVEDEKAELEEEKTRLSEREEKQKKTLEKEYNRKKEAKEKELKATDEYYDKLLETDALNAQTRYTMLNSNSKDLVTLLNSYNPSWQDAGQSLADSLLSGLNSQKESIEDAVNEMVSFRNEYAPNERYIDSATGKTVGYASGTSSNPTAGLYYTNEDGPEMSTNGDVAYVSKGAAIKNRMQTDQFIKSEIAKQVSLMRSSVLSEQANMKSLLVGNLARGTSNTIVKNEHNQNAPLFHAEHVHFNSENDIEQMAYKLGFYAVRNKTD